MPIGFYPKANDIFALIPINEKVQLFEEHEALLPS
jgi:hypothetical protein